MIFVRGAFYSVVIKVLFVNNAVAELGKLAAVPSVGCTYEVACDALELVDLLSAAVRALLHVRLSVLVSAVLAAVAIMVH